MSALRRFENATRFRHVSVARLPRVEMQMDRFRVIPRPSERIDNDVHAIFGPATHRRDSLCHRRRSRPHRGRPLQASGKPLIRIEPVLVNGGATIKSMSAAFMADVERAWRKHGPQVLDVLAEKYPQAFFGGMVAMTKVIRWETGADATSFSRTMTPEEVMDKLEERVGPEGRKLFEKFIRQVNVLQAKQQLEAQAQMGITGRLRRAARPV
jgi:hypothetical protein